MAAVIAFALLVPIFSFGLLEGLFNDETLRQGLSYLNLWQHMEDFSKGIVDTRRLVYYISGAALFLFLAVRALEAKKWR